MKLKIRGKEYSGTLTWGIYKKIQAGFSNLPTLPDQGDENYSKVLNDYSNRGGDLTIKNVWMCLDRRFFLLKPFIFKWNLGRKMSLSDIKVNRDIIINEMNMEISETGNPQE